MSDAFAAAAAALFSDPNLSMAASYSNADRSQVNVPVRVIYTNGADQVAGGGAAMGTISQQETLEVLQSALPDRPRKGAVFTFGQDGRLVVGGLAEPAKRDLTWRMVLTSE